MDITEIVQKKLGLELQCKQVVQCIKIDDNKRLQRFAALVEKKEEYGVFIFSSQQGAGQESEHLSLETVVAVDVGLRCQAEAPSRQDKQPGADFHLHLKTKNHHVLLEMPRQDSTTEFLTEIIKQSKTKQIYSQFFNESTLSQWLSRYGNNKGTHTQQTVTVEEFDPLKHMNIEQPDTVVRATDCVDFASSFGDNLSAVSVRDVLPLPNNTLHISPSWDSLDKIILGPEDSGGPMEAMKKQLGISAGNELPVGYKPVSSRDKFLRQCLTQREAEFTDMKEYTLFCGSWNVNGQLPPHTLDPWLLVDTEPPDIYAVGFQELDLSKEAFMFMDSPREADWQAKLSQCINSKVKYIKLKSIRLVGMLLVVFIKEQHLKHVSYIDADSVATGIMGIMGNKGGVSVRLTFHNTSLCFVTSHLAAHQDEVERRNSDYQDILSKMKFKQFEPPLGILEHDLVFWSGDLNYRIDLPIDDVKSFVKKRDYQPLYKADQLHQELKKNSEAFRGFKEGIPDFDPTFKFDPGTDTYDTSEKKRIPAYCDRILWRGSGAQQLRYSSHPQLKVSDHKPVSALFKIGVGVIDEKRYKDVYEEVMKKLDRLENEYLPHIKLDKTECVFQDVKFIEGQSQIVTVANVGQVPLEFEFVNKLNDTSFCRPWLKVTPSKSVIQEGQCCEVHVEVYVDKTTVSRLNSGEEKLEDILVLHLIGGKDSFITVTGNFLVSSFGSSIEALIQMHGPIREVPVAELIEIERPGSLNRVDIAQDGGRLYMVPKEIWKFVDFLHKNGSTKEELFQQPGRHSEIQFIRDCLDTGKPHCIPDTLSVHSVAESFLLFLECLAQPPIPYEFYCQCLASSNNLLLSKQLLTHLPDCHKNTFLYICAFLRELLKHSDKNGLDTKFLATMFGEVMLRQDPVLQASTKGKVPSVKEQRMKLREEEAKKAAFMYHFISHDIEL